MNSAKSTPKDAQNVAAILKEMSVVDYEPRVINQALEFVYRYVTNILEDALLFSAYAKKKNIDVEDVSLATQLHLERYFTSPPPRDVLTNIAKQKNLTPLPTIKSSAGLRLPPDRYNLTACNYHLKSAKKPRIHATPRVNFGPVQTSTDPKVNQFVNLTNKSPLTVVNKSVAPSRTLSSSLKPPPIPIIKFSDGNKNVPSLPPPSPTPTILPTVTSTMPPITMPTVGTITSDVRIPEIASVKRKAEDDDYDQE